MTWAGIDALSASGKYRTIPEIQAFVDQLPHTTWASGMVLHNTASPNLPQWTPSNRAQRILNLESYFRDDRGWQSAPHAFIDYDGIWIFTPLTVKGTHSPSYNGTRIGVEMVGDFAIGHDDDDTGPGFKTKKNTAAFFAMLHTHYGWNPATILPHKADPRTTHDCPGNDIDMAEFIDMVQEYMGHAGEHDKWPDPSTEAPASPPTIIMPAYKVGAVVVPPGDTLTLREIASVGGRNMGGLPNNTIIKVFNWENPEKNGKTRWLRVETPAGYKGWVSARYVMITGDVP